MANKSVFAPIKGRLLPVTDTLNKHAAPAYAYAPLVAKVMMGIEND